MGLQGTRGVTSHYFRPTVRTVMHRAGMSEAPMDRITGHEAPGSVGTKTYTHWGLAQLIPAVDAIRYPSLSLPVVSLDAAPSAAP